MTPRYRFYNENDEHRHELDGKPLIGTSTAVGVLGKPLTWWAAGMALTPLGWLNKNKSKVAERDEAARQGWLKISAMSNRAFADFLQSCYREHHNFKNRRAVSGTDMHAGLENYINYLLTFNDGAPLPISEMEGDEFEGIVDDKVVSFSAWALQNVEQFLWSEAHCYSEQLWTGGICDFGATLKEGRKLIIGDFKSSREAYFDQFIQIGGYARQIKENGLWTAAGTPISTGIRHIPVAALIVFPFGSDGEPTTVNDVEGYMSAFEAAITLYKLKQEFEK